MELSTMQMAGILAAFLGLLVLVLIWRRWRSDEAQSKRAHEAAQNRSPPVDVGETHEFGINEFTDHHSGNRIAVGKVEGFVIFAEDVPANKNVGDPIRVRILSFNSGRTSADAKYVGSG